MNTLTTQVCIVGGGPAGMMLGYLLARADIPVIVLEKWPDFFRDFRGDTIHPSTLEVLKELGLLEKFLTLPHNKTTHIAAQIGDKTIPIADFSKLPVSCPYIAFLPQWDFLNFIAEEAKKFPHFQLLMGTEGADLIYENNVVTGIQAKNKTDTFTINTSLVIGADGRHSTVREKSGLPILNIGAPMDVLWFRLSRQPSDAAQSLGRIERGRMMVMIERGSYWQCGFVIPKGYFDNIKTKGIGAFHADIARIAPELSNRFSEIDSWEKIKLLEVTVNRLKKWYQPGLLCIGDAAHAMSPVGGVGINLAIQDAVAAANILTKPLLTQTLSEKDLAALQKRRMFPTKMTQRLQIMIQNRAIGKILSADNTPIKPNCLIKLLGIFPWLQRIPARLMGLGFRPEHYKW